jgi:hypothetical protein
MRRENPGPAALLWVLAFACLLTLRLPFLSLPLERDEGEYAYIAWRVLEGEVPYRDAFDQKPPLVFAPYLLALTTVGGSVEALHGVLLAWVAATMLVVASLARHVARSAAGPAGAGAAPEEGRVAGAAAALLYAVSASSPRLRATAMNTEILMALPMAASVLAALRAHARGLAREARGEPPGAGAGWLAAGALAALACWFKQVAVVSAAALGVWTLWLTLAPGARGRGALAARRLAAMLAGGALVSLPVVAWFAAHGALGPLVDAALLFNLHYASEVPLTEGLANLRHELGRQAPALWPLWLLALLPLLHARDRRALLPVYGWLECLALGVCAGLYFRDHYFIQLLPALAVLGGVASARLVARAGGRAGGQTGGRIGRAMAAAGGLALLVALPAAAADRELLLDGSPERVSRALYGLNPFAEAPRIAQAMAAHGAPYERVFVFGSEPEILFLARRASASRYIYTYPLMLGMPDREARQREAWDEVAAARPRLVLVVAVRNSHLPDPLERTLLWDRLQPLLAAEYACVATWVYDEAARAYAPAPAARGAALAAEDETGTGTTVPFYVALFRRT